MSRARVLVVDDEPLAREMLIGIVEKDAALQVVGEAGDGRTAAVLIKRLSPDIVLMDVEMPERDGLEAIRGLQPRLQPQIIFVTAYTEYATEAFDVEAIDYVLKPVSEERLSEALARAKRQIRQRHLSEVAERVASITAGVVDASGGDAGDTPNPSQALNRIPIAIDGRTRFIDVEDIIWIESQDYYVRIHTSQKSPLVRTSLKSLKDRLSSRRFCRIHRGALVNVDHVVELQPLFKGAHAVVLSNGKRLRISRARWAKVREVLTPTLRPGSR